MKNKSTRSETENADHAARVDRWRQCGGVFYPDRHVPFSLHNDGFLEQPREQLPSPDIVPVFIEKNRHSDGFSTAAQQLEQLDKKEDVGIEDFQAARRTIDKLLLSSAADPHALAVLVWIIEYALNQLANLVIERQNKAAAAQLCLQLAIHVERLNELARNCPKLFHPLAHQLPSFPVMGSKFKAQQCANERLLNELLDVGRDFWNQQHRKLRASPTQKSSQAKVIAGSLIAYLQKYRIVYPELSALVPNLPRWTEKLLGLKPLSSKT